ncbi:MAG: ABC transporter permease [Verrucomicrobiae bacterium]|nr:ABC transporter permease [Verrucomicrobiae bacterium]
MEIVLSFPRHVGRSVFELLRQFGEITFLIRETLLSVLFQRKRWNLILFQIYTIGVSSQGVILLTGAFVGLVFSAQMFWQLGRVGLATGVGGVVANAMTREMGPTITALMIAGRVGAAIAAEIATMKVTEQIDALRAMATHPVDYLVVPRVLAVMVCLPILTAQAVIIAIFAAYLLCTNIFMVDPSYFMNNMVHYTTERDVLSGLIKAFFFGIIIVLVACYKGLTSQEGAEGVGRATTDAVVAGSVAVIISNFFITFLLEALLSDG